MTEPLVPEPAPSPDPRGPGSSPPSANERPPAQGDPLWILLGPHGLRTGWSILLFAVLLCLFAYIFGTVVSSIVGGVLHIRLAGETASSAIVSEGAWVMALAATLGVLSRIERRRLADYYLAGPAPGAHFCGGWF